MEKQSQEVNSQIMEKRVPQSGHFIPWLWEDIELCDENMPISARQGVIFVAAWDGWFLPSWIDDESKSLHQQQFFPR